MTQAVQEGYEGVEHFVLAELVLVLKLVLVLFEEFLKKLKRCWQMLALEQNEEALKQELLLI